MNSFIHLFVSILNSSALFNALILACLISSFLRDPSHKNSHLLIIAICFVYWCFEVVYCSTDRCHLITIYRFESLSHSSKRSSHFLSNNFENSGFSRISFDNNGFFFITILLNELRFFSDTSNGFIVESTSVLRLLKGVILFFLARDSDKWLFSFSLILFRLIN